VAAGGWGLGGFLGLLAAYLALHFTLRLTLSGTVGTDDVAEAIFAQSLEWSYYPRQPPLYTWLVWGAFKAFGVGIASLALVRYAAVALAYLFLYLSARRLLADPRLAALSAFSLSLIFEIGWSVHEGVTNTVLLTAACAGTFYAFVRVAESGSLAAYLGLGAALGIGLLSKYGYFVFAVSLLAAALMQRPTRRRVLDPRMGLSLLLAAAIVAPYLVRGFEGGAFEDVFRGAMTQRDSVPYWPGVASGLATLVEAAVLFLSPLWLILLAVFPRAVVRGSGAAAGAASPPAAAVAALDARRLLEHFFLAALAIIVLGILAADVTSFKSRWMHPGLILFPLYFFCRVEKAGFDAGHVRRYSLALVAVVALVIAFRVAQASVGPPLCDRCRLWMPYPELAEQIADAGFTRGTIVAADEHIAGNFRVRFPDSRVVSVGYDFYVPPPVRFLRPAAGRGRGARAGPMPDPVERGLGRDRSRHYCGLSRIPARRPAHRRGKGEPRRRRAPLPRRADLTPGLRAHRRRWHVPVGTGSRALAPGLDRIARDHRIVLTWRRNSDATGGQGAHDP
jgi:hypothetical protein